jgi:diguanylate cyclase (GGDEF)-like protein/PAS domain S-box-containing protein
MSPSPSQHPLFCEIADIAPVMIWMAGLDKLCNYFNRPWLEFTGRDLNDELGKGWAEGVHPEDLRRCLEVYEQSFDRRAPFTMEYRLRRHDGEYRWILDNGKPIYSCDHEFVGYAGSCVDISHQKEAEEAINRVAIELEAKVQERTRELAEANEALIRLSRTDILTGLNNRLAADQRIDEEFSRMRRTALPYAVLLADIDYFKSINDDHGHEAGDQVLRSVARIFVKNIRKHDFVARYGGEEFIFLLPSTSLAQATIVAEKIRKAVQAVTHPVTGKVTMSFGVAEASLDDADAGAAIREADMKLYEAKKHGRNRVATSTRRVIG